MNMTLADFPIQAKELLRDVRGIEHAFVRVVSAYAAGVYHGPQRRKMQQHLLRIVLWSLVIDEARLRHANATGASCQVEAHLRLHGEVWRWMSSVIQMHPTLFSSEVRDTVHFHVQQHDHV